MASTPSRLDAQQARKVQPALTALEQRSGAPLDITRSPLTDLPIQIRTRSGYPIGLAVPPSASADARAAAVIDMVAPALGLASAKDVARVATAGPDEVGMDHVRYRQTYNGIPVASADVMVHLEKAAVTSVNGHILPGISLATTPTVGVELARAIAEQSARKARKGGAGYPGDISLSEPRLQILNVGFFERRQLSENRLAWFIEARGATLRERIWVDARHGGVLLQFSQLTDRRNRLVYTAGGGPSLPGTLLRSEGQGPSGDSDVDYAYDHSGDTYDYYSGEHGRDRDDNAGATLPSTVDWCDAGLCGSCPCQNAFWNGTQMVYGDGFAAADDVVAHELTHAVTEYSANLVYCLQSGALNESFSDIFGETVDLTNTGGTDTPGVRWLMGEDVPDFGAIRDMSDPTTFGDPGKVSDAQFFCATSCLDPDNGGVHTNSGVPNHAFALMVDGGSYNAFTITGIGLTKAGKIQYRALTQYLTANAIFLDTYGALNQSCQDLIGTAGISAADCTEVTEALQAVEMNMPACVPVQCGNGIPEPGEACEDGNVANCDGCDANCTVTACGNGVTACGEACDDGNLTGGDGCEADCTLSPGCGIFAAADLPQSIPDLGAAVSTINVPLSGRVTDVNVVNLQGTHTFLGDLEFDLASPAGTAAAIIDNVCGGNDDFALGLDDEASSPIVCPATDGLYHQPSHPLSPFDGQLAAGNWTLTVLDQAGADFGTLNSWGLLICVDLCGNGSPDPGEECDDGNANDVDGCTNHCTTCGNGTTSPPEACDDGDLDSGDGCDANCTVTGCGNGVVTAPEECDDGNANDTDLCRNDCTIYIPPTPTITPTSTDTPQPGSCCVPQTSSGCIDTLCSACVCALDSYCCAVQWDSICVGAANNECAASCPCDGTPTPTPTPTQPPILCAATPVAGCLTPGKSILTIKDKPPGGSTDGDKLIWKWLKGPALQQTDLGNPVSPSNGFRMCVYDTSGLVAQLAVAGGGTCGTGPCWKAIGTSGYKYRDAGAASDGLFSVIAKGGAAGKSKIIVKGKDASLPSFSLPMDTSSGVTAQLFRDDTAAPCWQATFPSASTSDGESFKAKSETP